ncbi:MAG: hypothetical protein HYR63_02895 [Proteobacteria bacterium]|nr:hypothetical protein [Pseudomonadota bacterium]MBI3496266.1 hypothetical protein [Pseudomonadota bacterium]
MTSLDLSVPSSSGVAKDPRIIEEQVRLLYQGTLLAPINLLNAVIVSAAVWPSFPPGFLVAWIGLTALVVGLRLLLRHRYLRDTERTGTARLSARRFAIGALASGLLWGSLGFALPIVGRPLDFLFVTFVAAAMSAAAMTSMAAYFPALLCYLLPFILPPALAFIVTPGPNYHLLGPLVLLYAAVLIATGWNMSRSILRTLQLKIVNAALNESLTLAHRELRTVQQGRWGTFAHLSHELRTP